MLRFHLDEHVDHAIARGLRSRGIDVTTSTDAGLLSAGDLTHVEFAFREERVIFTNDADFLVLAASSGQHAGIVYAASGAYSIGHIVRYLSLMSECLESAEMAGNVEFL